MQWCTPTETLVALVPYALQALAFVYVANLGNTPDAIIDDLEIPLPIVGNVLGDFVSGTVEAAAMAGNFGAAHAYDRPARSTYGASPWALANAWMRRSCTACGWSRPSSQSPHVCAQQL